jgi:hypothetical protein
MHAHPVDNRSGNPRCSGANHARAFLSVLCPLCWAEPLRALRYRSTIHCLHPLIRVVALIGGFLRCFPLHQRVPCTSLQSLGHVRMRSCSTSKVHWIKLTHLPSKSGRPTPAAIMNSPRKSLPDLPLLTPLQRKFREDQLRLLWHQLDGIAVCVT